MTLFRSSIKNMLSVIASSPCEDTILPLKSVQASMGTITLCTITVTHYLTQFLIPHFTNNLILFNTLLDTLYTPCMLLGYTLLDPHVELGITHNYLNTFNPHSTC